MSVVLCCLLGTVVCLWRGEEEQHCWRSFEDDLLSDCHLESWESPAFEVQPLLSCHTVAKA